MFKDMQEHTCAFRMVMFYSNGFHLHLPFVQQANCHLYSTPVLFLIVVDHKYLCPLTLKQISIISIAEQKAANPLIVLINCPMLKCIPEHAFQHFGSEYAMC